jgi:hypothetical protein
MKKIIPTLVIGVLLLSGIGAVAINETDETQLDKNTTMISNLIFEESESYVNLNFKESTSINMETGKPMLPVVTHVYTYPLGTIINNVDVEFSGTKEYVLDKKIMPASEPVPLLPTISNQVSEEVLDEKVYSSSVLYPEERFSVRKAVGLDGEEIKLYLTIRCNPVQYSPALDTVFASEKIDIKVEYQPPENPVVFPDVYDMVIITPEEYQSYAQELADHKNNVGIDTTVKTVESILSDAAYSSGRDDPEKIKLFIKDALEDWGIQYVLLFGGRKGQTLQWDIPERRSNNDDRSGYEDGYSTDLYYMDIYKIVENETVFDDWDSNGNDIFAEFVGFMRDKMDFIPDVMVGRIPIRNSGDAEIIVDKIVKYETSTLGSWFNDAYVISGDTTPPVRSSQAKLGVYEGELATDVTAGSLEDVGFNVERLWTSIGNFAGPEDVREAYRNGAGFIHMAGHGSPPTWGEFLPDATSESQMVDGLSNKLSSKLKNGDMLPVVVIGGCHNAQFNVTFMNLIMGILKHGFYNYFQYWDPDGYGEFWYREWVTDDLCSRLLLIEGGGSIASLGNTGLGLGYVNEQTLNGLEPAINIFFFDAYTNQSKVHIGDAHGQSVADYVNFIGRVNSDNGDRKTIEEFILLGDPSLKIGGY